jgi:hypothetical protein
MKRATTRPENSYGRERGHMPKDIKLRVFICDTSTHGQLVCRCRSAAPSPEARLPRDLADMQARRDTARRPSAHTSANARDARVINRARARRRRRRADAGRIASRAARRTSLRRDGALGRIGASEGWFKCGRKTRLDLARKFADEDGAVFAPERGDRLVYAVALYEEGAVRVDVADGAEDAEEVQLDDGFAVG